MKKLLIFSFVAALLIFSVIPAQAAGGQHRIRTGINTRHLNLFELSGTVSSLDAAERTVTITVACGNKLVKPYIGLALTLQTNTSTRFLLRNPEGKATPITFEELKVGQHISANGKLVNKVWTTSRITVGAELTCLP